LGLKEHNHRAAQQLGGERHGERRRHPARRVGRRQVNHPLADHDAQGCQDGQQEAETGSQARIEQHKPDDGEAKETQSPARPPASQRREGYGAHQCCPQDTGVRANGEDSSWRR